MHVLLCGDNRRRAGYGLRTARSAPSLPQLALCVRRLRANDRCSSSLYCMLNCAAGTIAAAAAASACADCAPAPSLPQPAPLRARLPSGTLPQQQPLLITDCVAGQSPPRRRFGLRGLRGRHHRCRSRLLCVHDCGAGTIAAAAASMYARTARRGPSPPRRTSACADCAPAPRAAAGSSACTDCLPGTIAAAAASIGRTNRAWLGRQPRQRAASVCTPAGSFVADVGPARRPCARSDSTATRQGIECASCVILGTGIQIRCIMPVKPKDTCDRATIQRRDPRVRNWVCKCGGLWRDTESGSKKG